MKAQEKNAQAGNDISGRTDELWQDPGVILLCKVSQETLDIAAHGGGGEAETCNLPQLAPALLSRAASVKLCGPSDAPARGKRAMRRRQTPKERK